VKRDADLGGGEPHTGTQLENVGGEKKHNNTPPEMASSTQSTQINDATAAAPSSPTISVSDGLTKRPVAAREFGEVRRAACPVFRAGAVDCGGAIDADVRPLGRRQHNSRRVSWSPGGLSEK
jgi:hypothetical protein